MNKKLLLSLFILAGTTLCLPAQNKKLSPKLNPEAVKTAVDTVVNWQVDHFFDMNDCCRPKNKQHDLDWANGVFLSALASWAHYTGDKELTGWYEKIAADNFWQPYGKRMYHADDIAVCLAYAEIYDRKKDKKYIDPTIARIEFQMNHPSAALLEYGTPLANERWSWCDALYMAPPVYLRFANLTGDKRMTDFMDKEFWAAYDYLYDPVEKLFFRDSRFFDQKEANGKKVFWGRGNGWVLAGLTLILDQMPKSYPSYPRYVQLYKDMAARIAGLQDRTGYWHPSLLDPIAFPMPETSSSGFFTYSLWWGINNGLLDSKRFLPAAEKGWKALVSAVRPDGMLGWVQPIGGSPESVTEKMTETYGAAAFMMAGKEILTYLNQNGK